MTLPTNIDATYADTTTAQQAHQQHHDTLHAGYNTRVATVDGQSPDGSGNVTAVAGGTHAATSKTTPVNADEIPLVDSAASNVLKKLSIANLKTFLNGLFTQLATFTAKGDLLAATGSGAVARVAAGADGTVPTYDGSQSTGIKAKFPSRSVSSTSTDTTAVNTTTETVVASQAIPTSVAAGDVLRLIASGDFLNNTGSSVNHTYKVIVGGTAAAVSGAIGYATSAQRRLFVITAEMLVVNPASDQRLRITGEGTGTGTTGIIGANALNTILAGRGTAAEDLTAGKNFQVSVTLGTASASADFVCHESWLEIIKH